MLDKPTTASFQSADEFITRLRASEVKDRADIVAELIRVTYVAPNSEFSLLPADRQLPYLELLRDIACSSAFDGISRNNSFTALNTAQRYKVAGASALCDEAVKGLPKVSKPAGKSAGEESQVVAAAAEGMHLGDWVNAGRPTGRLKALHAAPKATDIA